jgi:hypothetical protein
VQLANAEEFQNDVSNGSLGEVFIRFVLGFAHRGVLTARENRCNNVRVEADFSGVTDMRGCSGQVLYM